MKKAEKQRVLFKNHINLLEINYVFVLYWSWNVEMLCTHDLVKEMGLVLWVPNDASRQSGSTQLSNKLSKGFSTKFRKSPWPLSVTS